MRIDVRAAEEHPVLDGNCVQLAAADANEGEALFGCLFRPHLNIVAVERGLPQGQYRRVQEFFPRMRAHGVTEQRVVAALD